MNNQKKSAFKRYAPFIQEYIYKKGWNQLYSIQDEACEAILDTDKDLILASGTATGKTEAVIFPILTELIKNPSETISVLYIGPLKALINDQFERLSEFLEDSDFPVWPWHGDVSQSVKNKTLNVNKGIIQITPESLEALLMRNPKAVEKLFSDLRYIIIDEIHALMGNDRGLQVISQINRLERLSHRRPRRIGLSATLNDYNQVKNFLSTGEPNRVIALGTDSERQVVGLRVESFLSSANNNQNPREALDYIYDRTKGTKSLIFTNSRKEAETIITALKTLAKENHESDIYRIHHGSLSAQLRKETEKELRNSNKPIVTAATFTLELGIDIGDLDQTIQIGAPFTCSNFVQRLGRSGRITGKSLMRFITYYESTNIKNPFEMPWDLLRTIAIIELYRNDKWIEPFTIKEKPYSLLIHQTLSILTSYGELKPSELARHVLTLYPFKKISQEEYKIVLKQLLENDYIQKLENGTLILGLEGEKLVNYYTFYAVFNDNDEYKIIFKGQEIGSLSEVPGIGQVFSLGGRSWKVTNIDVRTKTVHVIEDNSFQAPQWSSSGLEIDTRIFQKIRDILKENTQYPYLSPEATEVLELARNYAKESGLLSNVLINSTNDGIFLFPWCGTKEMRTLVQLFKTVLKRVLGIKRAISYSNFIYIETNIPASLFLLKFAYLDFDLIEDKHALSGIKGVNIDKFDSLLPDELKSIAILKNHYNLEEAKDKLFELSNSLFEV